jgi:hypothetical protein
MMMNDDRMMLQHVGGNMLAIFLTSFMFACHNGSFRILPTFAKIQPSETDTSLSKGHGSHSATYLGVHGRANIANRHGARTWAKNGHFIQGMEAMDGRRGGGFDFLKNP